MRRATVALFTLLAVASTASAQSSAKSSWSSPLRSIENSLVFHPQTAGQRWFEVPPQYRVEDVWLRSRDGQKIHAWWFPHPESTGAVLFCHGNAGNLSQWAPRMVTLQRALKQSVLIFDYPGYGKSTGKPSEDGCYAAADIAFDWLTDNRKIPADKVLLVGESLGGGVATELAVRRRPRALVLVRTFTSVPNVARQSAFTFASAPLMHNSFDNEARLPKVTAPVFLAHGDIDHTITLTHAQRNFEAARQPKRFFLMKGVGHNDAYPEDFYPVLNEFLRVISQMPPAADVRKQ